MKLAQGDIIKTTAIDNPFVYHSGIILVKNRKIMVVHNTPMRKNSSGGNVIVESLDNFIASGRKILGRKRSRLSYNQIMAAVEKVKTLPFNVAEFNCHDFVYYVRTGKRLNTLTRVLNKMVKQSSSSRKGNQSAARKAYNNSYRKGMNMPEK